MLRPDFGTATLPTGASVASSRGEAFFLPVFGTATPPRGISEPFPCGETVFYPVFGTAPLPTDVSVASSRGEGGLQTGLRHGGTATLPTDASVASSRTHCELVYRIVAELGFVKFTWHEPLLIIK